MPAIIASLSFLNLPKRIPIWTGSYCSGNYVHIQDYVQNISYTRVINSCSQSHGHTHWAHSWYSTLYLETILAYELSNRTRQYTVQLKTGMIIGMKSLSDNPVHYAHRNERSHGDEEYEVRHVFGNAAILHTLKTYGIVHPFHSMIQFQP